MPADDRHRVRVDVVTLARWPILMTEEVLALPRTLRDARRLVADLGWVTHQLADTVERLGNVLGVVESADVRGLAARAGGLLDDFAHTIEEVTRPLERAVSQVASIESSTTELRNAFFSMLRRIPGARGPVIDAVPTAEEHVDPEVAGTDADPREM